LEGQELVEDQSVAGKIKREYFAVSVSIPERSHVQAQLVSVERELSFTDEAMCWIALCASPTQGPTVPCS
jgi:hypothetical protein